MAHEPYPDPVGMCGINCALTPISLPGHAVVSVLMIMTKERKSKWKCRIRACVLSKQLGHCGECEEFPYKIRQ